MSLNIFDSIILVRNSGLSYTLGIKKNPGMEVINTSSYIYASDEECSLPPRGV